MSQLKDQFLQSTFIKKLARELASQAPGVSAVAFVKAVTASPWEELELMDRLRKITDCVHRCLPEKYLEALIILRKVAEEFKGFDSLVFPDFVGRYGTDHLAESIPALEQFTEMCSSEFAVRPFIERYPKPMFNQLKLWAISSDMHHRRLASEGCRPRLPWSFALKELKKDPTPIFPILEILKADTEDYVRRSVANNLNDISKDHPEKVVELVKRWQGTSKEADWIIKHACRTLLKQGRPDVMQLFGFSTPHSVTCSPVRFDKQKVRIGSEVIFSCSMKTTKNALGKVRLEYVVHFIKSNGQSSPKVFQIFEKVETANELRIEKRHSFKNLSTRKHFPGDHRFELRVNGVSKGEGSLKLVG
jgi:3-methyladenine DNA glycosylase AlkC